MSASASDDDGSSLLPSRRAVRPSVVLPLLALRRRDALHRCTTPHVFLGSTALAAPPSSAFAPPRRSPPALSAAPVSEPSSSAPVEPSRLRLPFATGASDPSQGPEFVPVRPRKEPHTPPSALTIDASFKSARVASSSPPAGGVRSSKKRRLQRVDKEEEERKAIARRASQGGAPLKPGTSRKRKPPRAGVVRPRLTVDEALRALQLEDELSTPVPLFQPPTHPTHHPGPFTSASSPPLAPPATTSKTRKTPFTQIPAFAGGAQPARAVYSSPTGRKDGPVRALSAWGGVGGLDFGALGRPALAQGGVGIAPLGNVTVLEDVEMLDGRLHGAPGKRARRATKAASGDGPKRSGRKRKREREDLPALTLVLREEVESGDEGDESALETPAHLQALPPLARAPPPPPPQWTPAAVPRLKVSRGRAPRVAFPDVALADRAPACASDAPRARAGQSSEGDGVASFSAGVPQAQSVKASDIASSPPSVAPRVMRPSLPSSSATAAIPVLSPPRPGTPSSNPDPSSPSTPRADPHAQRSPHQPRTQQQPQRPLSTLVDALLDRAHTDLVRRERVRVGVRRRLSAFEVRVREREEWDGWRTAQQQEEEEAAAAVAQQEREAAGRSEEQREQAMEEVEDSSALDGKVRSQSSSADALDDAGVQLQVGSSLGHSVKGEDEEDSLFQGGAMEVDDMGHRSFAGRPHSVTHSSDAAVVKTEPSNTLDNLTLALDTPFVLAMSSGSHCSPRPTSPCPAQPQTLDDEPAQSRSRAASPPSSMWKSSNFQPLDADADDELSVGGTTATETTTTTRSPLTSRPLDETSTFAPMSAPPAPFGQPMFSLNEPFPGLTAGALEEDLDLFLTHATADGGPSPPSSQEAAAGASEPQSLPTYLLERERLPSLHFASSGSSASASLLSTARGRSSSPPASASAGVADQGAGRTVGARRGQGRARAKTVTFADALLEDVRRPQAGSAVAGRRKTITPPPALDLRILRLSPPRALHTTRPAYDIPSFQPRSPPSAAPSHVPPTCPSPSPRDEPFFEHAHGPPPPPPTTPPGSGARASCRPRGATASPLFF